MKLLWKEKAFLIIGFFLTIGNFFIFCEKVFSQVEIPTIVALSVCGDGEVTGYEVCDGTDFAGKNCGTYGYNRGTLLCLNDCSSISTENCWFEKTGGGYGPGGGVPGGSYTPPGQTKLVVYGKAYPDTEVNILKDGKTIAKVNTDSQANFSYQTTDITPGVQSLSFWAQDKFGLKSILFTLTFEVLPNVVTTVRGAYLPPTISLEKNVVKKGEILNIFGQTIPDTNILLFVASPKEIKKELKANEKGEWKDPFDTTSLEDESMHTAKSQFKGIFEGATVVSSYSKFVTFYVGRGKPGEICPGADLNQDGKVNLTDFSILMYYWGTDNKCADQNKNGKVDFPDFSIMMYYWTG